MEQTANWFWREQDLGPASHPWSCIGLGVVSLALAALTANISWRQGNDPGRWADPLFFALLGFYAAALGLGALLPDRAGGGVVKRATRPLALLMLAALWLVLVCRVLAGGQI